MPSIGETLFLRTVVVAAASLLFSVKRDLPALRATFFLTLFRSVFSFPNCESEPRMETNTRNLEMGFVGLASRWRGENVNRSFEVQRTALADRPWSADAEFGSMDV